MTKNISKVETTNNGQATNAINENNKSKVPTGKVITKKDREERRKAREEQYKAFRVGALKRRAKRIGLTEEQTEEKIKALLTQLDTPNNYSVLIMFNPNDAKLLYAALDKEGIVTKMRCTPNTKEKQDIFCWIDADQETLATIREIAPPGAKIHPYVKKKPPVLEAATPKKEKKPSNNNKSVAAAAKKARKEANKANGKRLSKFNKRHNMAAWSKEKRKEFKANIKALKTSLKAKKKASGTIVPMKRKNGSTGSKKASTELKQAA